MVATISILTKTLFRSELLRIMDAKVPRGNASEATNLQRNPFRLSKYSRASPLLSGRRIHPPLAERCWNPRQRQCGWRNLRVLVEPVDYDSEACRGSAVAETILPMEYRPATLCPCVASYLGGISSCAQVSSFRSPVPRPNSRTEP